MDGFALVYLAASYVFDIGTGEVDAIAVALLGTDGGAANGSGIGFSV